MFNFELVMQFNNNEIYEIKGLLYTKINIEPPQEPKKGDSTMLKLSKIWLYQRLLFPGS